MIVHENLNEENENEKEKEKEKEKDVFILFGGREGANRTLYIFPF